MNLNSILIGSDDPKRLVRHYRKVLGPPAMEMGDLVGWQLGSGWVTVGRHEHVKGKNTAQAA